jgi:hypothetical protein
MKRILMMTLLGVVTAGSVACSTAARAPAERPMDEAAFNAKVDARLKQVLSELRAKTASGQELAVAGR